MSPQGVVTVAGATARIGKVEPRFHAVATAFCHWAVDSALRRPRYEMSFIIEGVVDGGMDVEKTLRRSGRLKPPHLALSSPHHLM
jgi:hypothetical protein